MNAENKKKLLNNWLLTYPGLASEGFESERTGEDEKFDQNSCCNRVIIKWHGH